MEKTTKAAAPKTVNDYLQAQPAANRPRLKELRKLIKDTAPKADEMLSYGIVGYKYHGMLIYFGGFAKHYSLFGAGAHLFKKYAEELKGYKQSKGTIQFPYDEPMPKALIKKLVKDRVKMNELAADIKTAAKKSKAVKKVKK